MVLPARRLAPLLALALLLAGCTADDAPAAGRDGEGGDGSGATTPTGGATPAGAPAPQGPAVAVARLAVDKGLVAPDEAVRVTVGLVATTGGAGTVNLLLDGAPAGSSPFSLAPSSDQNVTFQLAASQPGVHRVEVRAEGAEVQVGSVTFEVIAAGALALSELRLTPTHVDLGDVANVGVTVENTGATATSGSILAIVDGAELARKVVRLEPGERTRVELAVTPGHAGALPLRVGVASSSTSVEGVLTVRAPVVANATGTFHAGICSHFVSYVAEFDNAGDGTARAVVVTGILYLPNGTEHSRHSADPVDVHPGQHARIEVTPHTAQRCGQDDHYRLVVTIQPKQGQGVTIEHGPFVV